MYLCVENSVTMKKIECKHSWINKGTYYECSLCGEIKLKHSATMSGFICDDAEMGNYRFYQSEDAGEQSSAHPQNEKRD